MFSFQKSLLFTISLLSFISQAQAMTTDRSETDSASAATHSATMAPKFVNETVDIDYSGPLPQGWRDVPGMREHAFKTRLKTKVVPGIKALTLENVNFDFGQMIHVVDGIVRTYKSTDNSPVSYLNFTDPMRPAKTTSLECLVFKQCSIQGVEELYQIKGVLAPYFQNFSFLRGVRIIIGPRPARSSERECSDMDVDGEQHLADLLKSLISNNNGAMPGMSGVTIEKNY